MVMLLPLHIVIALVSIVFTAAAYFFPSGLKLKVSGALIASTIGTGTVLVIETHARMLDVCMTGLLYIGSMLVALIATQRKLARAHVLK